ncbi:MAG: hypothetical protein P1U37_04235 [Minwuia sp.]|nr:hypothetical protein [Minwuia sp.]
MIFQNEFTTPSASIAAFAPERPERVGADAGSSESARAADEDGFGFLDILDAVNPLQHIPIVSTLYREATGDEIGNPARIAGGFLFGGVLGLVSSVANAIIDETTGKDLGGHLMGLAGGDDPAGERNGSASDLRFQRASDAYQQLGGADRESGLDYVVEAP